MFPFYGVTGDGVDCWDLDLFLGNGQISNVESMSANILKAKFPTLNRAELYLKAKSYMLRQYTKLLLEKPL